MSYKIPTTMATQHPDNAGVPFWHDKEFISTKDEIEEIYSNFSELEIDEYMWDWEGKHADEGIFEKLFSKYLTYFKKNQFGKNINITLRVPNIWEEKTAKLPRAYISVLAAAGFCSSLKLHSPPAFEFILPMTKNAEQLMHLHETFEKTSMLHRELFGNNKNPFKNNLVNIIPLFESVDDLANCGKVLEKYIGLYIEKYKKAPKYLRVFIARSDPALNAGYVPAVIASRLATREIYRVSSEQNI